MAAPPPVNPAPPVPAFTLGPGRDNTVLDWSTPADTKLYYKAIAVLDNKFDRTPEKFIPGLTIRMELDTHHSHGYGHKGTAIRLRQDQHG